MNHHMKSGALTLSILALAACSDTVGLESFEDSLTLDAAMIVADATIDELGDMGLLFGGGALPAPSQAATRTGTHTATFFDVDGHEQLARDPLTTASIHLVIESTHEFSRDSWTAIGTRMRDLMITGLAGEETSRTVNGTGSSTVTRSQHTDADGTRTHNMSSTSVITNVVHPVPRTDDAWPLSGTITRNVTIDVVNGPNGDVTKSRTVVITFNGTNVVTMMVGNETFDVDLSTRSGRHPFQRRG
jgi:hypothetical protein